MTAILRKSGVKRLYQLLQVPMVLFFLNEPANIENAASERRHFSRTHLKYRSGLFRRLRGVFAWVHGTCRWLGCPW